MKTAIQTACNEILDELIDSIELAHLTKIINIMYKNLETEKQQIIYAVKYGQNNHSISISHEEKMANDYYTSTFETNKETLK
jgi:hypothetical protein